jgi:hypothetical protein
MWPSAGQTLALPVHQGLSTKDVDLTAEAVLQVLPKIVARRRHAMAT